MFVSKVSVALQGGIQVPYLTVSIKIGYSQVKRVPLTKEVSEIVDDNDPKAARASTSTNMNKYLKTYSCPCGCTTRRIILTSDIVRPGVGEKCGKELVQANVILEKQIPSLLHHNTSHQQAS